MQAKTKVEERHIQATLMQYHQAQNQACEDAFMGLSDSCVVWVRGALKYLLLSSGQAGGRGRRGR